MELNKDKSKIKHKCSTCGRLSLISIPPIPLANYIDAKYFRVLSNIFVKILNKPDDYSIESEKNSLDYSKIYNCLIASIPRDAVNALMMHFALTGIVGTMIQRAELRNIVGMYNVDSVNKLELLKEFLNQLTDRGKI